MNALMESRNEITISNPIASEIQSFRNDTTTTLSDIVKMISDLKIQVNGLKSHLETISAELASMKNKHDNVTQALPMFNQLSDDSDDNGHDADVSDEGHTNTDEENNKRTTKEDSLEEVVNISD